MTDRGTPLSLVAIAATLREAGCVFAEEEAALLLQEARTNKELMDMINLRRSGLPLEHILGRAEFCGLHISVQPGVFVPRHRTEFLIIQAVELASPDAIVLDLCCGSGAIGVAMLTAIPSISLYASDIDATAIECAKKNLGPLGGRAFEGDLFAAIPERLKGQIGVLVANTPYVPTGEIDLMPREARIYESRVSLDGGSDGLDIQRRIANAAPLWLAPGAGLLVESSERQANTTAEIFASNGLIPRIVYSENFDATVVIGMKSS